MANINTAMNVLGTIAAGASLLSNRASNPSGKYGNFMAELRKNSVGRTNLFEVTLTAPSILSGDSTARKLSLYAKGAVLPGVFLETTQAKRYGTGPNEKMPYSLQTNDITLSFIGDGRGDIYKFFYSWMQGIVRGDYSPSSLNQTSRNGTGFYEVEFKENYRVDMNIKVFNEQGDAVLDYTLTDAFPISLPDITLSWNESNGLMEFPVTFAFLQARLDVSGNAPVSIGKISELSTLQKLIKVGTAVQVLSSLRKPASVADAINVAGNAMRVLSNF
jgi:hypothetical protein